MLKILQQFYIQMETQSEEFHLFGGDLSTYTLRCKRYGQHVTHHGSIVEILYHAPAAMLCHWNMVEPHDVQIHRELMLMPILFTSYENYVQSSNSFFEGWNWMEDLNICQKPTEYGQSSFVRLLTAQVLWMVMTVHLKTSFVALWFLAEFLSVHRV